MGTRNITKVIYDGEVKCCQYGQWDGYPCSTGVTVLEWVKRGEFEVMKKCKCVLSDDDTPQFYTGAPATEHLQELLTEHFNKQLELMRKGVKDYLKQADAEIEKKYGKDALLRIKVSSRDTGAEILFIDTPTTLYSDEYTFWLNEPDWQVEAINVIDLDNEVVHMMWHKARRDYTFEEVRTMDIEKEMDEFDRCEE